MTKNIAGGSSYDPVKAPDVTLNQNDSRQMQHNTTNGFLVFEKRSSKQNSEIHKYELFHHSRILLQTRLKEM